MSDIEESWEQLSTEVVVTLFNQIDGVLFWVKDRKHRITALNRAFAERVKLETYEVIGKTDADLYYSELAAVFVKDDQRVLESGRPMRRKVELLSSQFGGIEWRSTTKLPLKNAQGEIVGTTGISRPLPETSDGLPVQYRAFAEIVEYARAHLSERVSVLDIAQESGMSIATLERRFKEHLQLSPSAFLSQLRLSHACELLRDTPLNMAEVALKCGYESAAAFSRAFRRGTNQSPSGFRASSRR
ncbi:MAG: AraC family transcriptional regulator [Verrucomicrobiota bacterium]